MNQISKSKLCYYCFGCNRLELTEFDGVNRCSEFVTAEPDYQNKLLVELKNNYGTDINVGTIDYQNKLLGELKNENKNTIAMQKQKK